MIDPIKKIQRTKTNCKTILDSSQFLSSFSKTTAFQESLAEHLESLAPKASLKNHSFDNLYSLLSSIPLVPSSPANHASQLCAGRVFYLQQPEKKWRMNDHNGGSLRDER